MRKLTLVVTALAGALACSPASAVHWVPAGNSADGKSELLVEVSLMRFGGDIRRTWTRRILAPPAANATGRDAANLVTQYLTRYTVNCHEQTLVAESTAVFFDYGTRWYWSEDWGSHAWHAARPGSAEGQLLQSICAWQQP
ncbi:MAG TPA: hypothetical protein VMU00_01125 [Steroidobacteraceae bacterium]|nr:hypothetical protein [Steroidobacteraceae bacterium]